MKKFITLLLVAFMLIGVLTSCDEGDVVDKDGTHETEETRSDDIKNQLSDIGCEFYVEWSFDGEYHWHACSVEGCDQITDKAEHTWDGGNITILPTSDKKGEKTFTCTTCGNTKTEDVELEIIDKEKWNAALQDNVFNNVTFKMTVKFLDSLDGEGTAIYKLDGNRGATIEEDGDCSELPADAIDDLKNIFINTSLAILDNYDDFEYDEENNCYKAKKDVVYSAAVANYTAELTVKNAVVTFDADLRVATIAGNMTQVISNGQTFVLDFEFTFSDYGTTIIG